jgi:hypothetical protein
MGCCDCGTKKKRKLPLAGIIILGLVVLGFFFWQ